MEEDRVRCPDYHEEFFVMIIVLFQKFVARKLQIF